MLVLAATAILLQSDSFAPRSLEFTFLTSSDTRSVSLVGAFNNWDRAAFPLKLQSDGKTWKGTFSIAPGVYPYLFVENGNKWVPDPNAPPFPDANGNINSKLVVQPLDYESQPGKTNDRQITQSPLRHRANASDTVRLDETSGYLKFRTRRDDVAKVQIELRKGKMFSMQLSQRDELFDTWLGRFALKKGDTTTYRFLLKDGTAIAHFGPQGLNDKGWFSQDIEKFPLPNPPDWVQDAVFYQIFPERFANGDPANDGANVQPWGTKPTAQNRMGGDLQGVEKHIGHLQELGINTLYLNPVFYSLSNHGYDTRDYHVIDPRFGTNQEIFEMVGNLKKNNIRTVLDAVFNHSSPEFFAFKRLQRDQEISEFKNWYFISGFPVEVKEGQKNYRTFAGVPTMPKLNQDNPACRSYFLEVAESWVREFGIAGWRLDVADEVSHDFWRAFRKRVKAANKDAFILGEVWGDAHEYLQGDEHDAPMNYRWREAVLGLLAYRRLTISEFEKHLERIREDYPDKTQNVVFNLLGSHDTERIRTIFKGDRKRQNLATLLQFTYPGVPSVYYGDEIGMEGGRDPDCRRCMEWDRSKWDTAQFNLYKSLISLRKELAPLRRGSYRTLEASDRTGLFRFERKLGNETVEAALNLNEKPASIRLVGKPKVHLGPSVENGRLTLGPLGFAVYSRQK